MKLNLFLLVTLLMADTVSSQCRTANWWGSFDRKGWSKCGATTEYVTGFYRNNKRNDDPIFLLEEAKCCKAPAPNQNRASTCKNANWWGVLDSTNRWALCPNGYFLQGLYRNTGNSLHHIEEGHCCKPNNLPSSYLRCYDHDVGKSFDSKGWSQCDSEYYMAGFYKGGCDKLYCIEKFRCCMMYDGCKFANWWGAFDHKGWVQCDSSKHYITGLWRNNNRGSNDKIFLLEEAKCCPAPSPNQNTASTCKTANWWAVLDKTNSWAVCPKGYFVQGFYRGSGDWLHNIEEAKCCKPNTFPDRYEHCYNENILSSFDNKGLSKCKQEGYYVAGIYRGGCDRLYCIETLKCCKMNVDECKISNPCKNGGVCSDRDGSYHCSCKSGYHGNNCQYDVNECENNPCKNGATCVNLQGSYRCDCANGYTGNNCETDINECSPDPCQNGGTCVDLVGSYHCDCKKGYSGNNCETDINECSPDPCQNGGTCVDHVGSYHCDCKTGYFGINCERYLDEVPPVFTYCPSDITIDDATTAEVRVNWQRATATDNSGEEPYVHSNKQPGQSFDAPGLYEVLYTATDGSGNTATCSFRITLERKTCPLYDAPKNGALACNGIDPDIVCVVMCNNGYDFEFNPALMYYCDSGQWQFYVPILYSYPQQLPWPDCSNPTNPSYLKQEEAKYPYFFFAGDANDPSVQAAIKKNYIDFMTSNVVPPFFCSFKSTECNEGTVEVHAGYYLDEVPPVFTYCPSDITIDDATTAEVRVHWQRATATDNSGERPYVYSEKQSGQYFDVPGLYEVQYIARDQSGNTATCSFRITLKRQTCPLYDAPKNGALACNGNNYEYQCVVMCRNDFDFEFNPAMLYYCDSGQWQFYVPLSYSYPRQLPWPDCSNSTNPSYLKLEETIFPYYFFDGDANDPNVQAAIKTNYIDFMTKSNLVPPFFCSFKSTECNEGTVEVYAGSS